MSNSDVITNSLHNDLFSLLISDIKTYTGKDPLLPWLRGIRKMRDSLPSQFLKEKLPKFLQKCAQAFQNDRRYKNDLRYIRVWLQLMDFVDDPRVVLRTMEANCIGTKKSLFYQAYALYYEKVKKFEEADKMYHLGVQNLAEPIDELQKSYEQFLQRKERYKKKKIQHCERMAGKGLLSVGNLHPKYNDVKVNIKDTCESSEVRLAGACLAESLPATLLVYEDVQNKVVREESCHNEMPIGEPNCTRMAGTAIVGKSEAEDARHHGLVEPTINTKEALNAINSMFREPLEPRIVMNRKLPRTELKADQGLDKGFGVFIDENLNDAGFVNRNGEKGSELLNCNRVAITQPFQKPLQIYVDDDENNEVERSNGKHEHEHDPGRSKDEQLMVCDNIFSSLRVNNAFVFPSPVDTEDPIDVERESSAPQGRVTEDTVVCRFVGATISDEPQVENVCHHGLVDPTINLKEAMDDINSMFGKPIDFVRTRKRAKAKDKAKAKSNDGGFVVLADDDLDCHHQLATAKNGTDLEKRHDKDQISKNNHGGFMVLAAAAAADDDDDGVKTERDLFEPTICTKEAMDEINKMFGMPLDF
ncbi:uncharacterized protein LOC127809443 isoform X2 [Diospyros lotus]|uniref:uncharacterized protein LOC127809443 isoform X2 n=1 Tax=Diospyros lotus TaxID=55363 RepID=UPI00225566D2|nr:uncharacterized protein LOC127809443 isoform X2 [Diospyros lotus]